MSTIQIHPKSLLFSFLMAILGAPLGAALHTCTTGPAISTFDLRVKPGPTGVARPLRSMNILTEGDKIVYRPVEIPIDDRKKAKIALVLLPPGAVTEKTEVTVLEPKPANEPAEWDVPMRVGSVALVYGPQGLEAKKVTSLLEKDRELVSQLADYAEKTQTTEALIAALMQQQTSEPNATQNLDAAVKAFATHNGIAANKLDRTKPLDQQTMALMGTLNPAIATYDPLAPQPAARVGQSASIAASVAGLFLGNGVGIAAGGAAMFINMRTIIFPNTEFRSALVQPTKEEAMSLCGKRDVKSRTRMAFLWAMRVPNLPPPHLEMAAPVHLPLGVKSNVVMKPAPGAEWKTVDRANSWKLEPLASTAKPVLVPVRSSGENTLELDLTKAAAPPGNYRLVADWDWTPFQVAGEVAVHPLPSLTWAKLTPASQDRLVQGAGTVTVELAGTDFQFVEKAELKKASDRKAVPVAVSFDLDKGKRAGVQDRMTAELDTRTLENSVYLLMLTQADGKRQEVPVRVLPPNPKIANTPIRVNLGEKEQTVVLKGSGLDRVSKIEAQGAQVDLLSGGSAEERKAVVRLGQAAGRGQTLDLSLTVLDHQGPLVAKEALAVAGARPRIDRVQPSLPNELTVGLKKEELPAGYTVSFAMRLEAPVDQPRVEVACTEPRQTLAPLSLRPGEQKGTARVGSAGSGMLFLSFDAGDIGQTGCQLQVVVETDAEGRSDAKVLGKVLRLPRIDALALTGEKLDETTYAGELKGQDLETVEKTGWDATHGIAVRGLPSPVAGDARRQVLGIALPWPSPAPRSPLYIWLRGETSGRQTTVRY